MSESIVQIGAIKGPSAFDQQRPPEISVMDKCVHCGFCLPACPTYVLWGEEMDSPRGRIWMMRKATQGEAVLDQTFRVHIDNCLGCMACMTACPSGVEYTKLIEDTRGQVERNIPRGFWDSMYRKMLFMTFPHPGRLRVLAGPMWVYQRTGLQALLRKSGVLKLLPERLHAMESLLPRVPSDFYKSTHAIAKTSTGQRPRVGMLTGCVQDVFFGRVNRATMRVLAAEGFEVVVPEAQGCCGALMVHSGLDKDAADMAKRTIESFEKANVETIVINAAGCGSTMKEYGHLLRDDPAWSARAHAFSARCKDISEVLTKAPLHAERHPLPMQVAYHDACHLQHAQGIREQPRSLLAGIPGMEVREIADASLCCGSAGVYNLLHPDSANKLGDQKVENLLQTGAEAVVSANPGCLLQLMHGLRRRGHDAMPTFHMVELLDASIRGIGREEMMKSESAN
jgi:glycolate oxidase iron-sulfur subunit